MIWTLTLISVLPAVVYSGGPGAKQQKLSVPQSIDAITTSTISNTTELKQLIGKADDIDSDEEIPSCIETLNEYMNAYPQSTFVSYRQRNINDHMCGGVVINDWQTLTTKPCAKKIMKGKNVYAQYGYFEGYDLADRKVNNTIEIKEMPLLFIVKVEAKFPVEVYLQRAILPKESLINVNYQDVRSIALDKDTQLATLHLVKPFFHRGFLYRTCNKYIRRRYDLNYVTGNSLYYGGALIAVLVDIVKGLSFLPIQTSNYCRYVAITQDTAEIINILSEEDKIRTRKFIQP